MLVKFTDYIAPSRHYTKIICEIRLLDTVVLEKDLEIIITNDRIVS